MIHTKIWVSNQFNSIKPLERLLYIGMITLGDDDGRLRGDGAYLRHNIFPFDKIGAKKVEVMRDRIAEVGLIIVYASNDNVLIQHPKWNDYQKLVKKYRKLYGFPPPPEEVWMKDGEEVFYEDKISQDKVSQEKKSEEKRSEDNLSPLETTRKALEAKGIIKKEIF